jgi:hypothetical protein
MALTASRVGQVNAGGDASALFLKVFTGEVISAFEKKSITLDKHFVRTITSGKSGQFPIVGRSDTTAYLSPGTEINTTALNHNEKNINIDGLLYDGKQIAEIDELMNHYDVRAKYSQKMGENLAQTFDQNVMCEIILGARANALVTGLGNGTVVTDANLASATAEATRIAAWITAMKTAAANWDTNFVPAEGRYLAVPPATFYFFQNAVTSTGFNLINRDFGGEGSVANGSIIQAFGFNIINAATVPTTDLSAKTFHGVNAVKTQGIAWQEDCVGTLKLKDIAIEQAWDTRLQATLLVGKCAMGHGYLYPAGLAEFAIV